MGENKLEEALDVIARKMRESMDHHGPQSIAISQGTGRGTTDILTDWRGPSGQPISSPRGIFAIVLG